MIIGSRLLSRKPMFKGHEERRDSFVKTALFVLRVSGNTQGINKCNENSRPWREPSAF